MRWGLAAAACAGLALVVIGIAGCHSMIGFVTSEPADWKTIQSVGGIAIHEPVRQATARTCSPSTATSPVWKRSRASRRR